MIARGQVDSASGEGATWRPTATADSNCPPAGGIYTLGARNQKREADVIPTERPYAIVVDRT